MTEQTSITNLGNTNLGTSSPATTTAFDEAMEVLEGSLKSQLLVSQDRCVDGLLDLYNVAANELVRQFVVDILDDIRHLSSVRASHLQARLNEVRAALAVELAFCA
jgi:hypothetical protein